LSVGQIFAKGKVVSEYPQEYVPSKT